VFSIFIIDARLASNETLLNMYGNKTLIPTLSIVNYYFITPWHGHRVFQIEYLKNPDGTFLLKT
jgi:hypothetical protein